jgi:hypothetical protein
VKVLNNDAPPSGPGIHTDIGWMIPLDSLRN